MYLTQITNARIEDLMTYLFLPWSTAKARDFISAYETLTAVHNWIAPSRIFTVYTMVSRILDRNPDEICGFRSMWGTNKYTGQAYTQKQTLRLLAAVARSYQNSYNQPTLVLLNSRLHGVPSALDGEVRIKLDHQDSNRPTKILCIGGLK